MRSDSDKALKAEKDKVKALLKQIADQKKEFENYKLSKVKKEEKVAKVTTKIQKVYKAKLKALKKQKDAEK